LTDKKPLTFFEYIYISLEMFCTTAFYVSFSNAMMALFSSADMHETPSCDSIPDNLLAILGGDKRAREGPRRLSVIHVYVVHTEEYAQKFLPST
jgi:hypothetical protein